MNCKPGEMAYIRIPEGRMTEPVRVQLNGMPVVTVRLEIVGHDPFWDIKPPLVISVDHPFRDAFGKSCPAGRFDVCGLPDDFLVPIRGDKQSDTKADEKPVKKSRFAVFRRLLELTS